MNEFLVRQQQLNVSETLGAQTFTWSGQITHSGEIISGTFTGTGAFAESGTFLLKRGRDGCWTCPWETHGPKGANVDVTRKLRNVTFLDRCINLLLLTS
jgi:hypothetical protein